MSGPTRPCPGCGIPVGPDIKFCGQCGRDLREQKHTMMGMPLVTAADVQGATEAPRVQAPEPAAEVEEPPKPAEPAAPSEESRPPSEPSSPVTPAKPAAAHVQSKRTMLGMTLPNPPRAGQPVPAEPPPAEQSPAKPAPAAATNRTMLGMPKPDVVAADADASRAPAHGKVAPSTNRTMLGMPSTQRTSGPPAAPIHGQRERAAVRYPHEAGAADSGTYAPPMRGPSMGMIAGLLGALVLLAAIVGVAAYFLFGRDEGSGVRASVAHGDEGEQLRVEVPGAAEGTKVRFAGEERALESGVATFPLSADSLHLGDNDLAIDVIGANGEAEQSNLTLSVRYRVRADLSGLGREPPAIDVVVDALPGSEVTLDGEPVALDADGHGSRTYPVAVGEGAPSDDAFAREIRYRVKPPGESPEEGTVRVRVPYAQMQLDRPGTDVVTDRDAIEIAGAVHGSARVTVDGTPVDVRDGRFVHPYPLPAPGEHTPRIVTHQSGRAPRVTTIRIRRVEDMTAEAASFVPDEGMTYARVAQNPDIYRGQKVALEGRVYNVAVASGRSDLQILVRDCPRGQRCPLWVSYPAATDVTVDQWVRVLGTVGGEQQFRSETNRVIAVPRVDARFVLPLER